MAPLAIMAALLPASAQADRVVALLQERTLCAVAVTLLFAAIAYRMRAVNLGGTIAGAVISFVLYVSGGPGMFLVLATVFGLTAVTTPLRRSYKRQLHLAESRSGRDAWQVLANLSVAATLAAAALFVWHQVLLFAAVAALAEAASDTVSSECGQALARRVYLITSLQRAAVGQDGAISLIGTAAGAAAATVVAMVATWTGLIPPRQAAAAAGAAILGNLFDSLLGATVQHRGWLNNSAVNLLSTAAAAGITVAFLLQDVAS